MTMLIRMLLVLALIAAAPAIAQVPPAPPLAGQADLAARLVDALRKGDADACARMLDPAVEVHVDGRLQAKGAEAWMRIERPRLADDGVRIDVLAAYGGAGRVLLVEYFNSTASFGSIPTHCCWSYDAVRYELREGKIVRIDRLRGGAEVLAEAVRKRG